MTESVFEHTQLKIYKPPFTFLETKSACQKSADASVLTWDKIDLGILQSDWLRAFLASPNSKSVLI